MKFELRTTLLVAVFACIGCTNFHDDGSLLALRIADAAKRLRASGDVELTVSYEPIGGIAQQYEVVIGQADASVPPFDRGTGLAVTSRRAGHSTHHRQFVVVPRELRVSKSNEPLLIVLQKKGDRIEVAELR